MEWGECSYTFAPEGNFWSAADGFEHSQSADPATVCSHVSQWRAFSQYHSQSSICHGTVVHSQCRKILHSSDLQSIQRLSDVDFMTLSLKLTHVPIGFRKLDFASALTFIPDSSILGTLNLHFVPLWSCSTIPVQEVLFSIRFQVCAHSARIALINFYHPSTRCALQLNSLQEKGKKGRRGGELHEKQLFGQGMCVMCPGSSVMAFDQEIQIDDLSREYQTNSVLWDQSGCSKTVLRPADFPYLILHHMVSIMSRFCRDCVLKADL